MTNEDYFIELCKLGNMSWVYGFTAASFYGYLPKEYVTSIDNKQNALDSIASIELDALITKYGFPNRQNTGNEGASIAFSLIHHTDIYMILKYQNQIAKIYHDGFIGNDDYARYIDRILVLTNCPQKYGTQLWYESKTKKVSCVQLKMQSI